ncbi:hypothetical protein AB4K20DRAFT_1897301 [Rhizopus microsporus]
MNKGYSGLFSFFLFFCKSLGLLIYYAVQRYLFVYEIPFSSYKDRLKQVLFKCKSIKALDMILLLHIDSRSC